MIPLTLFLLACAAIYLGTIQAAFNALMRVSLRLLAEGSGRAPDLERYLQEPLLLFLPQIERLYVTHVEAEPEGDARVSRSDPGAQAVPT